MIQFFVPGEPIPQGSKTQGKTKSGRSFIREDNPRTKPWRKAVADAAAFRLHEPYSSAVVVRLSFQIRKRTTTPKRRLTVPDHASGTDLDKLTRAILDGLTGPVLSDDVVVCGLVVAKQWSESPGVHIRVIPFEVVDGDQHWPSGWRGWATGAS